MNRRTFFCRSGAAAAALVLASCTTIDDVKDARGKGAKRTYKQSYDEVFGAALHAANKQKLEIVSSARDTGTILLSSGATFGSFGERIAIFVARLSDRSTTVEVVARPVIATVSFPPDWPRLLFGEIEEELTARRLKR